MVRSQPLQRTDARVQCQILVSWPPREDQLVDAACNQIFEVLPQPLLVVCEGGLLPDDFGDDSKEPEDVGINPHSVLTLSYRRSHFLEEAKGIHKLVNISDVQLIVGWGMYL